MDEVDREFMAHAPPVAIPAAGNGVMVPSPQSRVDQWGLMLAATKALAERVMRWAVLGMSFALFAWCAARPDWIRLATACAFTLMVLAPMFWRERKR